MQISATLVKGKARIAFTQAKVRPFSSLFIMAVSPVVL